MGASMNDYSAVLKLGQVIIASPVGAGTAVSIEAEDPNGIALSVTGGLFGAYFTGQYGMMINGSNAGLTCQSEGYGFLTTGDTGFAALGATAGISATSSAVNGVGLTASATGAGGTGLFAGGTSYGLFSDVYSTGLMADLSALTTLSTKVSAANIIVVSPVGVGGDVTIVQGDSYKAADARALSWTSTAWPSLAGATVTLNVVSYSDGSNPLSNVACTVIQGTGTATVSCDLTSTQTSMLAGRYRVTIKATLADGDIVTLVSADMTVT